MKQFIVLIALVTIFEGYSQIRRDRNGIPQAPPSKEVTQAQLEKQQREIEEKKQEFIANFVSTLEADDFQKEIISQSISSFYDKKLELFQTEFDHRLELQSAIKKLEETHFKELESLISKNDMAKINDMIKGNFDEKELKKKKKKKKKKKRKNKAEN